MMPRKRVYTTFHGYESYPIRIKAIVIRKISEVLSRGTICIGDFMKKWYFAKPDVVIYGGVDLPKTTGAVKDLSAFFFGRLDEQTGIVDYCEAVKKIRKNLPDFKFVIAGDGKHIKLAQKYGKTVGFIREPEKLLPGYRFAFVSRYLGILEALAARKPVFALFDNPVKEDYLKITPFAKYINILNNPNDLASLVQFYCSNNKIGQEKIEAGYSWVKKRTWGSVAGVYERLWSR
jgi:glycosyltransferase involved in cell wall biosynthesis